ncbi:MAG: glutaminyl-peptide cyclotransferase [Acidimicrobiales bacterium]
MAIPTPSRVRTLATGVAVVVLLGACGGADRPTLSTLDELTTPSPTPALTGTPTPEPNAGDAPAPTPESTRVPAVGDAPEMLTAQVLDVRPHDPEAFTQGLVLEDGRMFESTGDVAPLGTVVREVDPLTGEVLDETSVPGVFGEGLEWIGDRLLQLTWKDERLIVFDVESLEPLGQVPYEGEGWGLCLLDERLAMSDGSDTIAFRSPQDFSVLSTVSVTLSGEPLLLLNELECVDGQIWANVFRSDSIVRIDPGTGVVTAVVDTSALDRTGVPDEGGAVLNGIAYDEAAGTFLITGKLWPSLFEVVFVPA